MRTLKQNLRLKKEDFDKLKVYCKCANSLYNCTIYEIRAHYELTGKYIGLKDLDKLMQNNVHYKIIPSFNAQQIIRLVDKNYRSFFVLLKKKLRGEYADKVNPPKFRKKGAYFNLIFDNTRIYIKNNKLKLYKDLKLKFTHKIENIKQGIICWNGNNFVLHITYEQENKERKEDNGRYLGIDFGVNNLASCISNVGQAFIISGRPLKSINQFYNKQKSQIQSELEKKNKKKWSKKLAVITNKRSRRIGHYFYCAVSQIVKFCIENNINTIHIGYNPGWKQDLNIGRVNNQNFQYIPFADFRNKLENRCEKEGVNLVITEESYTSKTSFIDCEQPIEQDSYCGKRVHRGLFKTAGGKLVNADCNAAAQILSKNVILNRDNRDKIGAVIVTPVKTKVLLN